jgi:adenylate kinase family enzyme
MIIFLNGSINSGKSTIAKLLVKELSNTALLEIDSLREMVDWMPLEESIPLNLENVLSLIRNFIDRELNVVIPYPLSQKNYDYLTNELKDLDTKIYAFTLSPKLEKVLMNRGSRELSEEERERIKYHYKIEINTPTFGEIIDNSDQTPEETVKYIYSKLELINI